MLDKAVLARNEFRFELSDFNDLGPHFFQAGSTDAHYFKAAYSNSPVAVIFRIIKYL